MKIALLGPNGFIGSSLTREFKDSKDNIKSIDRDTVDIFDSSELTKLIFGRDVLINCIGSVGGIAKNLAEPVALLEHNAMTSLAIIKAARNASVAHLVQFVSACVYPMNSSNPMRPSDLGKGAIEDSSRAYAAAKILSIENVRAHRRQFGFEWISILPTNIYGDADWNHGEDGHVIGMLVHKFAIAMRDELKEVIIWGDGTALRDFLNVEDLASATKYVIENKLYKEEIINIAGSGEISINDLAELLKSLCGFKGKLIFEKSKPSGAPRKLLDDGYLRGFGWKPKMSLEEGLSKYVSEAKKQLLK
jgi:GDP-L-fucose synthase